MTMNPQKLGAFQAGLERVSCQITRCASPYDPISSQDATNLNNFDESILQQGRFWMRTVTWTLVGTSFAWLG